jgi:ABC-type dipeptide/oligopeptide/nickel transport system ATPase subunit
MLFDEATASLDSHTEKQIQAALKNVTRGRTTITIAYVFQRPASFCSELTIIWTAIAYQPSLKPTKSWSFMMAALLKGEGMLSYLT